MNNPPESYLTPPPSAYKHEWWHGQRGKYHYLQSMQLSCGDFFKVTPLPKRKCRVLAMVRDSYPAGSYYGDKPGWKRIAESFALSPVIREWEALTFDIESDGDSFIVFEENDVSDDFDSIISNSPYLDIFQTAHIRLGTEEDDRLASFWNSLEQLKPALYISDRSLLTLISPFENILDRFQQSKTFKCLEEELRDDAIKHRLRVWNQIGPEVGPEQCIEPDCDKLRIKLAIRCFVHQLDL